MFSKNNIQYVTKMGVNRIILLILSIAQLLLTVTSEGAIFPPFKNTDLMTDKLLNPFEFVLDHYNPQQVLQMSKSNSSHSYTISMDMQNEKHKDWKFNLLIHKFTCGSSSSGGSNPTLNITYYTDSGVHEHTQSCLLSSSNRENNHFLSGLINVTINTDETYWSSNTEAILVASTYFDQEERNCPKDYFNCNHNYKSACGSIFLKSGATDWDESGKPFHKDPKSRCIHDDLVCNKYPSCGTTEINVDESDVVCCRGLELNWEFIVMRALGAFIFVLIPTLVVFLLFYRRQVAIQRARLLQQVAMARRRNYSVSVITASDARFANDTPPTYDDVYDIKEPPPCFCEAVALATPATNGTFVNVPLETGEECRERAITQSEGQGQRQGQSPLENGNSNPGFECTCRNS